MPNPGKPLALKLLTGSRRVGKQAPSVNVPALQQVPRPPDWLLNDSARAEWNHLAPLLVANGLLTEGSLSVLAHACNLHGVITRSFAAGEHPKAATLGIYRLLVNDFGLTPVAREKTTPAAPSTSKNRFHRNGQRPQPN